MEMFKGVKMKCNQLINLVELRHMFENSKSIFENPTLSENTESNEQDISQERIVQFPA